GAGVHGMTGMPVSRPRGQGQLLRPLLRWPRSQLADWAAAQRLNWIEDPANADPRYARTALRHQLLPYLREHWSTVPDNLLRLAGHAGEAVELLDERAAEDLQQTATPLDDDWLAGWPSLDLDALQRLSAPRRTNLLRFWLRHQGLRLPDQRHLNTLLQQLAAQHDTQPELKMHGARIYRSSGRLWLLPGDGMPAGIGQPLASLQSVALVAGNGWLHVDQDGPLARRDGVWRIGYRQGGEQIKLPGRPAQSLKKLFQEADIPAWLRPAVPLLYCDDQLVSVAGRWNAEQMLKGTGADGFSVRWEPIPH